MEPRINQQNQSLGNNLTTQGQQLSGLKAGSYVKMMAKLFEISANLPNTVHDNNFNGAVVLDAKIAQLKQHLEHDDLGKLNQLSGEINTQLEQLKQNKSTVQFAMNCARQYEPLKQELLVQDENYRKLLGDVGELSKKQQSLHDVFKKYHHKEISRGELETQLTHVKNNYNTIAETAKKLFESKRILSANFHNLHVETSQLVAAAKGASYQMPSAPTQQF